MKRFLVPLMLLIALGGAAVWWFGWRSTPQRTALRARELATWGLAQHLSQKHPGCRVLVVANPFTRQPGIAKDFIETEEAGIRGVRRGLGTQGAVVAVAFPELKPDAATNPRALLQDADTTTPLSYLVTEDAFDKLLQQYAGSDTVVSLIGLPVDLGKVEAWTRPGLPRFALLLPDLGMIGNASAVKKALQSGKLAAFVLARPGGIGEETSVSGDSAAEFEKRFVLVTAENFDAIRAAQPSLFPAN